MMDEPDTASDRTCDFRPTASWQNLRLRAELLRKLRQFFFERGFLEVETPLASADVVVDRHLDPLSFVLPDDPRKPEAGRRLWLCTLAAGQTQPSPVRSGQKLTACWRSVGPEAQGCPHAGLPTGPE